MNPLSPEEFHLHPETMAVLHARARRARAEAIHNLLAGLLAAVIDGIGSKAKSPSLPFRAHWG